MKNIIKERETGMYLGLRGDNKYYASSSQTTKQIVIDYWIPNAQSLFVQGAEKAATSLSYPNYLGREKIDYITGAPDNWNPCIHRRVRAVQLPYLSIMRHNSIANTYYVSTFKKEGFVGSPVVQVESHLSTDYQAARSRAWHTMQPRFEPEISMLNFLWELKDVRKMITSFLHILRKYRHACNRAKKLSVNPVRAISDGVLTWNFGVAPLLSDLTQIWASLQQVIADAQAAFKLQGQEPNTYHYSEPLAEQSSLSYGTGNSYYKAYGLRYRTVFTATMEFGYEYKMRGKTDAFMQYWGLHGSWETFFNMVPFSFILDYFLGISKALHFMNKDKNVTMHMLRYMESLKTKKSNGVHILNISKGLGTVIIDGGGLDASDIVSGYESTLYSRRLTRPLKGMYVPKTKAPSDKQKLNLLCLAVSLF